MLLYRGKLEEEEEEEEEGLYKEKRALKSHMTRQGKGLPNPELKS